MYRIGYIVKLKKGRKLDNSDKYYLDNFPDTIASKYFIKLWILISII